MSMLSLALAINRLQEIPAKAMNVVTWCSGETQVFIRDAQVGVNEAQVGENRPQVGTPGLQVGTNSLQVGTNSQLGEGIPNVFNAGAKVCRLEAAFFSFPVSWGVSKN
jgi:hypothetical protein